MSSSEEPDGAERVRLRVIILVLLAQFLLTGWVADSEIARGVYVLSYSLMMPTVLYLLIAGALSRWLGLKRHELLLGYIVLTATLPIVSFGGLRFVISGIGYLAHFSQTQPQWMRYQSYLPTLPVLHDPAAIRDFYEGHGAVVPWSAWIVPIAFWSAYLLLLAVIWLRLAAILHRAWIRQERLSFPITVLPLGLTDPTERPFRRRGFWLKGHPRLFIRPERMLTLRVKAQGELKPLYEKLLARCEELLKKPFSTEEPARYPDGTVRLSEAWRTYWKGAPVPTKAKTATARWALGAVLVYRLALW